MHLQNWISETIGLRLPTHRKHIRLPTTHVTQAPTMCTFAALPPAGPAPCFLLSAVLCGGKRMADTTVKGYVGGLRHIDPRRCWQAALFRHWTIHLTLAKNPLVDITDDDSWFRAALWPGIAPDSNVDYDTLMRRLKVLQVLLGIPTGKMLHAFRVYAARYMDQQGVADEVSCLLYAVSLLSCSRARHSVIASAELGI